MTTVRLIEQQVASIKDTLEKQSRTLEYIRDNYATKEDLKRLKEDMERADKHLEDNIHKTYGSMKKTIDRLNWLLIAGVAYAIMNLIGLAT
jgi:hypothetical protein